jgi:hypothetical protein
MKVCCGERGFWHLVVGIKYGSLASGRCTNVVCRPYGMSMSLWKYFRRGWDAFSNFVRVEVSDGAQTRFWHGV